MSLPSLRHERACRQNGWGIVAGVDEAGRGPLAGPVCVAAVVLPEKFKHPVLNDSKQLTAEKREQIYRDLTSHVGLRWSVVFCHVEEIDRINILQATYKAMREAIQLLDPPPDGALIDGNPVPQFPIPHRALVDGDCLSLSIAAASIVAKVTRDRFMLEASVEYPHYGFERHKGYGTPEHLAALAKHGPCPLHRRSFAPVAQLTLPLEFEEG
jgi:ribonuclease HII